MEAVVSSSSARVVLQKVLSLNYTQPGHSVCHEIALHSASDGNS